MINLNFKLKRIEERLARRPTIDPVIAIQRIGRYIDLSCNVGRIPENEQIAYYDFVWMANNELDLHDEGKYKESKKKLWEDMESSIRVKKGFRPDERDEEATQMKKF